MSPEVKAALIGGLVAIVVAYLTASRTVEDRLLEFRTDFELALFEERLAQYGELFEILLEVSSTNPKRIESTTDAANVVRRLNEWHHGKGGLIASSLTRGAVVWLRNELDRWSKGPEGTPIPNTITEARNAVLLTARLDVGLKGRELFDFSEANQNGLIERIEEETNCSRRGIVPTFNTSPCLGAE